MELVKSSTSTYDAVMADTGIDPVNQVDDDKRFKEIIDAHPSKILAKSK